MDRVNFFSRTKPRAGTATCIYIHLAYLCFPAPHMRSGPAHDTVNVAPNFAIHDGELSLDPHDKAETRVQDLELRNSNSRRWVRL